MFTGNCHGISFHKLKAISCHLTQGWGSMGRASSHLLQTQARYQDFLYIPLHWKNSPQVSQFLFLEEDFLRFVKTRLLSFYVRPEAASPLIPWMPGPAFPVQQQQGGPPAFVLLQKTRKAEFTISSVLLLILTGTFWPFNSNLRAGRQLGKTTSLRK